MIPNILTQVKVSPHDTLSKYSTTYRTFCDPFQEKEEVSDTIPALYTKAIYK